DRCVPPLSTPGAWGSRRVQTDSRGRPAFGDNRAPAQTPPDILEADMDAKPAESLAQHQPRLEDDPLVRGLGRYAADAPLTGQTYAYFVRSPHAFADIPSLDADADTACH